MIFTPDYFLHGAPKAPPRAPVAGDVYSNPSWEFLLWVSSWLRTIELATGQSLYKHGGKHDDRPFYRPNIIVPSSPFNDVQYYAFLITGVNSLLYPLKKYPPSAQRIMIAPPALQVAYALVLRDFVDTFALEGRISNYWKEYVEIRGREAIDAALSNWSEWMISTWQKVDPRAKAAMHFARLSENDLQFDHTHPYVALLNWTRYLEMLKLISASGTYAVPPRVIPELFPNPFIIFEPLAYRLWHSTFTPTELIEPL